MECINERFFNNEKFYDGRVKFSQSLVPVGYISEMSELPKEQKMNVFKTSERFIDVVYPRSFIWKVAKRVLTTMISKITGKVDDLFKATKPVAGVMEEVNFKSLSVLELKDVGVEEYSSSYNFIEVLKNKMSQYLKNTEDPEFKMCALSDQELCSMKNPPIGEVDHHFVSPLDKLLELPFESKVQLLVLLI